MNYFINSKGFKIIKTSKQEIISIGGFGICDSCAKTSEYGYLIPALGSYWYCEKCYDDWDKRAKFYEEDVKFETQMHDKWIKIFKEKEIGDKNGKYN